jgi:hypothetical protein
VLALKATRERQTDGLPPVPSPAQSGRYKQQTRANQSQSRQRQPGRPFEIERSRQEATPVSAARLAAEAAFASPQFNSVQNYQAQITVRRARVVAQAEAPETQAIGETPADVRKGPRIFRVLATPTDHAVAAESAPERERLRAVTPEPVLSKRRRRNVESNKQPGPVVVVLHQQPSPKPSKPVAVAPKTKAGATGLDAVDPIWAEIQKAQSFRFMDDGTGAQWQRLSQRADDLLKQLRGQRRK